MILAFMGAVALVALVGCRPFSDPIIGTTFFFEYMSPKSYVVCRSKANGETVTVGMNETHFCEK